MQCEVRGMGEMAEAAQGTSDTLPKPGRVNEVCREWLVKEDGALAYRLQTEEKLHRVHSEVRRLHIAITNQIHTLKQTVLSAPVKQCNTFYQTTWPSCEHGLGRVYCSPGPALARQLENTVCAELRNLCTAVQTLEKQLRSVELQVQTHYTGNKSRNALVRQDFPRALDEQRQEEEEAAAMRAMYHQMLNQQEKIDEEVAKELAERIEKEEMQKRLALELEDKEIARRLQPSKNSDAAAQEEETEEKERHRIEKQEREEEDIHYDRDMNNVGLPSPSQALAQQFRLCTLTDAAVQTNSACQSPEDTPMPPGLSEDEARRLQEEQDAELARLLQEQEGGQHLDMLDQDRLLAIEAQDKELARLLQERERAKAKRIREKAKQKALLKKQQQQQQMLSEDEGFVASHPGSDWVDQDGPVPAHSPAIRPTDLDLTSGGSRSAAGRSKPRFPDPEAIEVLPTPEPGPSHATLPNIAMAIDPTYPRRATITQTSTYNAVAADTPPSNVSSPAVSLPPPEFEEDDSPVPPYMPIQGQRRSASLEKKNKKSRSKDGCKQQ